MNNLKFALFAVLFLSLTACSDDSLDSSNTDSSLQIVEDELTNAAALYSPKTIDAYQAMMATSGINIASYPPMIFAAIEYNYPNAKITSIQSYAAATSRSNGHYSVELTNGIEAVIFEKGHQLAIATLETKWSNDEVKAGDLPFPVLLNLYKEYRKEPLEEIRKLSSDNFRVDFKNGTTLFYTKSGRIASKGFDDNGDDDDEDNSDDSDPISSSTLPQVIKDYLATNYPSEIILKAEKGNNYYEIKLTNGYKLKFALDGTLIKVEQRDRGNSTGEGTSQDINISTLPQAIIDYVETNYPGMSIVNAEKSETEYELTLSNGIKLEFDLAGNFKEISGHSNDDNEEDGRRIDASALPMAITDYLATNYPGLSVIKAEEYSWGYEVVLSNGIKLEFNQDGSFREISGSSNDNSSDDNGDDGQEINPANLPQTIKDYLASNYSGIDIVKAEVYSWGYEVKLINDVKLEFNLDGSLREVSGSSNGNSSDDSSEDGRRIDASTLPMAIIDYLAANYAGLTVIKAEVYSWGYEVVLSNGLKLEFNLDGTFREISGSSTDDGDDSGQEINPANLPQAIKDYLAANYSDLTITKAEVYDWGYEVKLSNGLKIEFNLDGSFREISGSSTDNGSDDNSSDDGQKINPADLPQVIKDYISTNYPGVAIDKAERYSWGYEVELKNDVKLKFTLDGTLI